MHSGRALAKQYNELVKKAANNERQANCLMGQKDVELANLHRELEQAKLQAESAKKTEADVVVLAADKTAFKKAAQDTDACAAEALVAKDKAVKELASDQGYLVKLIEASITSGKRPALGGDPQLKSIKREFSILGEILTPSTETGNDMDPGC